MLPTLSCCLVASPLWAQEAVELPTTDIQAERLNQDTGYTTSQASTASKSNVPIKEEAQSINVVTQQTLADYQVQSLEDAMKFVSGVSQGNTLGGSGTRWSSVVSAPTMTARSCAMVCVPTWGRTSAPPPSGSKCSRARRRCFTARWSRAG